MEEKESKFELHNVAEADEKTLEKIDSFILDNKTNGEFVNSLKYLSYHPIDRFQSDSVYVIDKGSKEVRGVMLAALDPHDNTCLVSHPGTSFAGPIISRTTSILAIEEIVNLMLDYYEAKYKTIVIRPKPEYFSLQPVECVPFFLLKRGYEYGMVGISNVVNISQIESPEDLFAMYDSGKRNHTRKVLKSEKFVFEKLDEIKDTVWDNLSNTLSSKHGVNVVHTLEEIRRLRNMFPENICAYYANMPSGEYGASSIVYKYKDVFHTQYLDVNYKYANEYPNLLLFYEMFLVAKKEGYKRFSIGISSEDGGRYLNQGLYNYKAGYGGGSIIQSKYTRKMGE